MRRLAAILVLTLAAAGCAGTGGAGPVDGPAAGSSGPSVPAPGQEAFDARARQVADAWRASSASTAWRTGFVPLQDLTVEPPDGFPDGETKQAFIAGWFANRASLPGVPFGPGAIRFPDSSTLTVPLIGGYEAYAAMDKGDPPPCSPGTGGPTGPGTPAPQVCKALTVTDVTLGQTTLRTSRGEASVPAWLFTIEGLRGPVARVAVAPSAIAPVPTPDIPAPSGPPGMVNAQDFVAVEGTKLTYRLGVGACDKDIRPLFYETDAVVVVGGTVTPPTGSCIAILKLEPVSVTMAKPLGARVVVDAGTGAALTLTVR